MRTLFIAFLLFTSCSTSKLIPAHSHNDYEQDIPLKTAMEHNFKSIEVDVHFIENKFLVSHDTPDNPANLPTLEELYLEPLKDIIGSDRRLQRTLRSDPLILLIDIKSDADECFSPLDSVLRRYSDILVSSNGLKLTDGFVKAIISGNRPITQILNSDESYMFIDGRPNDLKKNISNLKMPLISENIYKVIPWTPGKEISNEERTRLSKLVEQCHSQNKMIRFWASPDNKQTWKMLSEIGVDLINTDLVEELSHYIRNKNAGPD